MRVVVVGGGFLVGSGIGLWRYVNHDRPELIDDGHPVTDRMNRASGCAVPTELTALP